VLEVTEDYSIFRVSLDRRGRVSRKHKLDTIPGPVRNLTQDPTYYGIDNIIEWCERILHYCVSGTVVAVYDKQRGHRVLAMSITEKSSGHWILREVK
jgi:hypothetical protein